MSRYLFALAVLCLIIGGCGSADITETQPTETPAYRPNPTTIPTESPAPAHTEPPAADDAAERMRREVMRLFTEPENRVFDVVFPVEAEGAQCYEVRVYGTLNGGGRYLIDVFAVNPEDGTLFFLNNYNNQFQQWYRYEPEFASLTSPDGSLRIEGVAIGGIPETGSFGEIRIIDLDSGEVFWSYSSYILHNSFAWNESGRYVAAQHSGRMHIETVVVDTYHFETILLPYPFELPAQFPEISEPLFMSVYEMTLAAWVSESVVAVDFMWFSDDGTVSGRYWFDVDENAVINIEVNTDNDQDS